MKGSTISETAAKECDSCWSRIASNAGSIAEKYCALFIYNLKLVIVGKMMQRQFRKLSLLSCSVILVEKRSNIALLAFSARGFPFLFFIFLAFHLFNEIPPTCSQYSLFFPYR